MPDLPLDAYRRYLQDRLTPARYAHSLGVMRIMADLAPVCGLDPEQGVLAGLLHDAAKDLTPQAMLDLATEAGLGYGHPCERQPVYLHALLGATLARRDLGVTDKGVLDAIAAHSHAVDGEQGETPLSVCLRAADLLAPVRCWIGQVRLRRVAYAGRLDEADALCCRWVIEFFEAHDIPVHPLLRAKDRARVGERGRKFFARW